MNPKSIFLVAMVIGASTKTDASPVPSFSTALYAPIEFISRGFNNLFQSKKLTEAEEDNKGSSIAVSDLGKEAEILNSTGTSHKVGTVSKHRLELSEEEKLIIESKLVTHREAQAISFLRSRDAFQNMTQALLKASKALKAFENGEKALFCREKTLPLLRKAHQSHEQIICDYRQEIGQTLLKQFELIMKEIRIGMKRYIDDVSM